MTRPWTVYFNMELLRQNEMGRQIVFFREVQEMVQATHEHYFIARCPRCHQVVEVTPDDSSNRQAAVEMIATWQEAGYPVDRITRALLNSTPRGCSCKRVQS